MHNVFIGRNALIKPSWLPSPSAASQKKRSISTNTGIARGLHASRRGSSSYGERSSSFRNRDSDDRGARVRGGRGGFGRGDSNRGGSSGGNSFRSFGRGSDRGGFRERGDFQGDDRFHSNRGDSAGGAPFAFEREPYESTSRGDGFRGRGDRSFGSLDDRQGFRARSIESSIRKRGDFQERGRFDRGGNFEGRGGRGSRGRGGDFTGRGSYFKWRGGDIRGRGGDFRGRGGRSFDSPRTGGFQGFNEAGDSARTARGSLRTYPNSTPGHLSSVKQNDGAESQESGYVDNLVKIDYAMQPIPYTKAASTFLYGYRSVLAALQAGRRKFYKLYIGERHRQNSHSKKLAEMANEQRIPIEYLPIPSLDSLVHKVAKAQGDLQQNPISDGVCLEASQPPQLPLTGLGAVSQTENTFAITLGHQSKEDLAVNGAPRSLSFMAPPSNKPLLIWLHGTVDMRNVGAIMRTAVYYGVDVIMSKSATPTAGSGFHRTSAGASEYVRMLRVVDHAEFIENSKKAGWKFFSAVAPGSKHGLETKPILLEDMAISPATDDPCVVVLGNEDMGLPPAFTKLGDFEVSIGGRSKAAQVAGVDSLNVSIAAALLIERFSRKLGPNELETRKHLGKDKLF